MMRRTYKTRVVEIADEAPAAGLSMMHVGRTEQSRRRRDRRKESATCRVHDGGVGEHPILVVDDEPMVREVLGRYLAMDGFEVVAAADGEEALARFAGSEPALVLLDLMLPKVDGYEVFRRIRNSGAARR